MKFSSASALSSAPVADAPRSTRYAEYAYQGSTIVAVILLLGSLWLFR
jgi:hypothetical protein